MATAAASVAVREAVTVPVTVVLLLVCCWLSGVSASVPTPGGLGAVEAALVGGLTATGVPVGSVLTAVLACRTATYRLPAPLGWAAFVALQRHGRI